MIKIGKREEKRRAPSFGWHEITSKNIHNDSNLPKVITFGGAGADNSKNGNGVAKSVQSSLFARTTFKQSGLSKKESKNPYSCEDIAEIYSCYYQPENGNISDLYSALSSYIYSTNQIKGYPEYSEGENKSYYTSEEMIYSEGENSSDSLTTQNQYDKDLVMNKIIGYLSHKNQKYIDPALSFFSRGFKVSDNEAFMKEFLEDVKNLTQDIFSPILLDGDQKRDIEDAISKNNITFVTHCFGSYITHFMEENLIDLMKNLNYSDKEIDRFCKSTTITHIAPPIINPESKFTNYYLGATEDQIFNNGFDRTENYEEFANKNYIGQLDNIISGSAKYPDASHTMATFNQESKYADEYLSSALSTILVGTISNLHNRMNEVSQEDSQSEILSDAKSNTDIKAYVKSKYKELGINPLSQKELNSLNSIDLLIDQNSGTNRIENQTVERIKDLKPLATELRAKNIIPDSPEYFNPQATDIDLAQGENESLDDYKRRLVELKIAQTTNLTTLKEAESKLMSSLFM